MQERHTFNLDVKVKLEHLKVQSNQINSPAISITVCAPPDLKVDLNNLI
jgi:hypothetical protein